jgi:hypothetical protein
MALGRVAKSRDFQSEYSVADAVAFQIATVSECRYRWLGLHDLDLQRGHPGRRWIAHEWRFFLVDNQDATSRVELPSEKKTGFLRMHRSRDTG